MLNDGALEWRVDVEGTNTSVLFQPAACPAEDVVFVCAHGAGGHMRDRNMEALAGVVRSCGIGMVRFNFLYREQGSSRPDPMPRLKACMGAVIAHTRRALVPRRLIVGGRSMGGRTASMLAAEGLECDGLLLLAYPLHPAGKPEKLRSAHLGSISMPALCFNGTRDTLCRRDLMEDVLSTLGPNWRMHWLDGADHSFHVLKASGRTNEGALQEIATVVREWLPQIRSR